MRFQNKWDQTPLQFVPTGQWTGEKIIPIANSDDKRQVTQDSLLLLLKVSFYLLKSSIKARQSAVPQKLQFQLAEMFGIVKITG